MEVRKYTLSIEGKNGEQLDEMELTDDELYMLERDIKCMRDDSPDYPDAWSEKNRQQFDRLVELLGVDVDLDFGGGL